MTLTRSQLAVVAVIVERYYRERGEPNHPFIKVIADAEQATPPDTTQDDNETTEEVKPNGIQTNPR